MDLPTLNYSCTIHEPPPHTPSFVLPLSFHHSPLFQLSSESHQLPPVTPSPISQLTSGATAGHCTVVFPEPSQELDAATEILEAA